MVAIYTSAGKSQIQSLAYSHDNGSTFTKFKGNPIIPNQREARDPNMFWHEPSQQWIMVLADALEQQMQIYTSPDLKEWTYQSSFGKGYGSQFGVWECPDLMEIEVEGTKQKKWVLVCNINPGGPFGRQRHSIFRRRLRRQEVHHQDTLACGQMDGLRQGPLRHRELEQTLPKDATP